ncbi:MAG: beta-galactosidase, partial [Prevotellaceae bacterium]|nr:beta-galactosidase [Prevotellaceae bacterium]
QEKLKQDGEIQIMTYGGVPEGTVERYRELKDAGIDICWSWAGIDNAIKTMDNAHKAGVKIFLCSSELKTDTEKAVKKVMNHPALAGYVLADEPPTSEFKGLAEWIRKIQAIDSKHLCYINLLPNYATFHQLGIDDKELYGAPSYREYLETFVREVPVSFISFDHYPVVNDGKSHLREQWYSNLEDIRHVSQKSGLPFWAYTLSVAHRIYPVPTVGELRLQMYSNLAYGAQTLQYFCYSGAGYEDYHSSPISFGKRTEVYDRIKLVNHEIKALSGVFLNSRVIGVWHTGTTTPSPWITARMQEQNPAAMPPVKLLQTGDAGAVVSLLEKGDSQFLVIVNRDYQQPTKLTLITDDSVKKVQKDGALVPASAYAYTTEIDPGDVAIYTWKK